MILGPATSVAPTVATAAGASAQSPLQQLENSTDATMFDTIWRNSPVDAIVPRNWDQLINVKARLAAVYDPDQAKAELDSFTEAAQTLSEFPAAHASSGGRAEPRSSRTRFSTTRRTTRRNASNSIQLSSLMLSNPRASSHDPGPADRCDSQQLPQQQHVQTPVAADMNNDMTDVADEVESAVNASTTALAAASAAEQIATAAQQQVSNLQQATQQVSNEADQKVSTLRSDLQHEVRGMQSHIVAHDKILEDRVKHIEKVLQQRDNQLTQDSNTKLRHIHEQRQEMLQQSQRTVKQLEQEMAVLQQKYDAKIDQAHQQRMQDVEDAKRHHDELRQQVDKARALATSIAQQTSDAVRAEVTSQVRELSQSPRTTGMAASFGAAAQAPQTSGAATPLGQFGSQSRATGSLHQGTFVAKPDGTVKFVPVGVDPRLSVDSSLSTDMTFGIPQPAGPIPPREPMTQLCYPSGTHETLDDDEKKWKRIHERITGPSAAMPVLQPAVWSSRNPVYDRIADNGRDEIKSARIQANAERYYLALTPEADRQYHGAVLDDMSQLVEDAGTQICEMYKEIHQENVDPEQLEELITNLIRVVESHKESTSRLSSIVRFQPICLGSFLSHLATSSQKEIWNR